MKLVCLLILFFMLLLPTHAQTGNGTITGTVEDANKAVIPGVTVSITNNGTKITRSVETNEEGRYSFPEVPIGSYQMDFTKDGFKKVSNQMELQVEQTAVIDITLPTGDIRDVVTITDTPTIPIETTEIADVKDAVRIRRLPLNGREISRLLVLTPGVEAGDTSQNNSASSPRVNGLKVGSLEVLQDGVSIVNRFGGGLRQQVQPGLDTVQEFRLETSGSTAQYDRPATVILSTRSGTNDFHGSLFETHRNNAGGLVARRRNDFGSTPKLIRNEYGISAGGPVFLPKFGEGGRALYDGRNRSFWFFAYEGLKQRQSVTVDDQVPTLKMRNGDFSEFVDPGTGQPLDIYDPLTTDANGLRQPFPGNVIPQNRISEFYRRLIAITPLPTNNTNPVFGPNFSAVYPRTADTTKITFRGDHKFSDTDNLMVRFTEAKQDDFQIGGRFGTPPTNLTNGYGSGRRQPKLVTATIQEYHTFSPTLLNDISFNVARDTNGSGTLADSTNWDNILGLPNPFNANGWPTLYGDFEAGNVGYYDADNTKNEHLTAFTLADNLTWTRGNHSFTFGGKARSEYNNVRELQQAQGSHGFFGSWTALYDPANDSRVPFTGNSLAATALGIPGELTAQANRGYFYFRQKEFAAYASDTWKLSRRLTLNLGLRWNFWTPYSEKRNRFVNIDPASVLAGQFQVISPGNHTLEEVEPIGSLLTNWATVRGLTWVTADQIGYPKNLVRADYNNFQPRIGMAYQLNDKTVLRGFYGEFFWPMPLSQLLQTMRVNPPLNLRFVNPVANLDDTDTFALRTLPQPQYFVGQATIDVQGIGSVPPFPISGLSLDGKNWKDNRTQSWHVSLERELPWSIALRLSYKGEHASDLEQRYALNAPEAAYNYVTRTGQQLPSNGRFLRPNPLWSVSGVNKTGYSNTNSGEVEIERRFAQGLAFQGFYVFSRSANTTDADGFGSGDANINATGIGTAAAPVANQIIGNQNLSDDQLLRLVYYNSGFVPQHRVRYNFVYELPIGRGKRFLSGAPGVVDAVLGGWQIAGIGEWRSGLWLGANTGLTLNGDPRLSADERLIVTRGGLPERIWFRGFVDPTSLGGADAAAIQNLIPLDPSQRALGTLNANGTNDVFVTLANGSQYRVGYFNGAFNPISRNFIKGPGFWNTDLSAFKSFTFKENMQLRFQADFFNVFNHPVDPNPDSTTGLQDLWRQANDPRIIQFGLRFSW